MGRPLTAADRMPEPGDVLADGYDVMTCVVDNDPYMRFPGMVALWSHVQTGNGGNVKFYNPSKLLVYRKRADGGTVTTDD